MAGLVYASVMERLKQAVADGKYPPGHRLPSIKALAKEFGVGEGSVREAVRILDNRGILKMIHGSGIFVDERLAGLPPQVAFQMADLEERSLLDLFQARRALEPELAALAAERATDEERKAILDAALAIERKVAAGQDHLQADLAFHQSIAAAARNSIIARMMETIHELLVDSRRVTMQVPGVPREAASYHRLIAEAINNGDPEQARAIMYAHLCAGMRRLWAFQAQDAMSKGALQTGPR